MFEHSSLQELYTGSLIAGKGKHLNSIRTIMERMKFKHEDWARVRFGAGTPWRRCWCVIEPPDEKEWQRAAKTMKKRSAYERPQYPKGDIKFYDTKKTKKVTPIATITDAYSAYAIYPQSKPLIDQSTLVKVEGKITIHSNPESKTEGFVFVMPELHPAVSGFEMMLRWLFPVYDSFHLYGRPNRLIAETLDTKGLMFAMPKERRYGYLDIIDVAALIHTDGSNKWSEREWRKHLKDMTAKRMATARENGGETDLRSGSKRNSMGSRTGSRNGVRYDDLSPTSSRGPHQYNMSTDAVFNTQRKVTAPPVMGGITSPPSSYHHRSASESVMSSPAKGRRQNNGPYVPSRLSMDHVESSQQQDMDISPVPSAHHNYPDSLRPGVASETELLASRNSSDSDLQIERTKSHAEDVNRDMRQSTPPGPVERPPEFQHQPTDRPQKRPEVRPEMIRQKSRLSNATLDQMVQSSKLNKDNAAGIAAATAWRTGQENQPPSRGVGAQNPNVATGISANQPKAMVADGSYTQSPADIRPPEIRQPSEQSITLAPPPPLSQSRSTSQSSIRRKPVPLPPAPAAAPPPVPTRMQSDDSASKYSNSNYNYDSDESPDYASTVRKSEDEKSIPKPRTGVLKTVGDTGFSSTAPAVQSRSDIPEIDFGPTRALTPGPSRPSTAMGVVGTRSPFDSPADSTPERRSRTPGDITPENKLERPGHSRGGSYAWQPPAAVGRVSPGSSLTPEEFVQQRFNASHYPSGYVPHRSSSASKIEQVKDAPKKLQKKRDSRSASRNSTLLQMDYSSNLSAREQEHVARMTGGPLLNMNERSRTPDPSVGLIGAIEAREQEKRNIREGVSGHMVQAAIAQRQHHANAQAQQAAERAYAQQQQQSYGQQPYQQPQQQYTSWGQPIPQQQPQQQQQWGGQQYYQQQQGQWQGQYNAPRQQQGQQWQGQQYQQPGQGQNQQGYNQQRYGGFYQG
jgi:CCR4-NOT transcriptional complex subunit CAF120